MVEELKKTGLQAAPPAHCYTGPGDEACDVCTGRKLKAVKSCLVCLASYCETHLKLHNEISLGKRHKLIDASGHLQEKICSHHDKLLEVYCRTDQQCICYLCTMDEHKGHDTVSAAAEWTEKQKQLGVTQRRCQQRIQEREKELQDLRQAVQSYKHSAQAAVEDSERIFTELIHSIERRRSEVKELIRDQEKAAVSRAEGLLERLEQEIAELRRRDAELEQLSHTEEHIHFLQSYQSLCAPPGPGDLPSITVNPHLTFEAVRKFVSQLKEGVEDVCKGELDKLSGKVGVCSKMAEASISVSQDQFSCSICLDLLKDPVTIPCGHSYCMGCIKGCWDQDDHTGVYSCPQCRQTFTPRPVLYKNTMFAELVEKLKKTGLQAAPPALCYSGPGDVACDVCTGRKLKAIKSCLVCLASYCETHLKLHNELNPGKRHKLIDATGNLQEKICSHHDKLLEIYCRTDQQCICYLCTMDEHKGHDTVSAAAERTEKQKPLDVRRKRCLQRIQEREKELQDLRQAVQSLTRSAQAAVEDSERIFTELIRSIERRRSEVKELIRDQEKAAVSWAEGLLERLEQEIAELRRRDAELEQLSHTEDHIHFLQHQRRVLAVMNTEAMIQSQLQQKGLRNSVRSKMEEDSVSMGQYEAIVEELKKTGLRTAPSALHYIRPGDVACDVCTGRKLKAVKSCLVCQVSYCETHLQPHYESPAFKKHKLVQATENLQEKICSHHDKLLEVYCRTDQQCICYLCTMDEHKGHDIVSAAEERAEKQKKLGSIERQSEQRIQERKEELQDLRRILESLTRSAQTAVEDSERIFTQFMRRRRSEVKELIRDKEKALLSEGEGLLERLEQEIADLRRRDAELEQLSHTEDHIYFLQVDTAGDAGKYMWTHWVTAEPLSPGNPSLTFYLRPCVDVPGPPEIRLLLPYFRTDSHIRSVSCVDVPGTPEIRLCSCRISGQIPTYGRSPVLMCPALRRSDCSCRISGQIPTYDQTLLLPYFRTDSHIRSVSCVDVPGPPEIRLCSCRISGQIPTYGRSPVLMCPALRRSDSAPAVFQDRFPHT
ncbi:hypothetical protein JZ751_025774, partial [Albula glossodonta]